MNMYPLISVVIPFFSNINGLLIKAVKSALSQSVSNIEVIVVDDCSPLKAVDELGNLEDSRVKVIELDKNCKGGLARNTGIDNAQGEFVAFLDYDDIWYPDKLAKQLELFSRYSDASNEKVIYSRCNIIEGDRHFIRPTRALQAGETVGEYLFVAHQIIQTSGIFLRTEIAKVVKFDDIPRHQDYQFCLALENYGCVFEMLEEPSYEFIQVPKLNDYKYSIDWLDAYSSFLNTDAMKGFRQMVIIRSMFAHREYVKAWIYSMKKKEFFTFLKFIPIFIFKNYFPQFMRPLTSIKEYILNSKI